MIPSSTIEKTRLPAEDAEMLGRHLADEADAQQEVFRRLGEQERLLARHDVGGLERFLRESDPILARLQTLIETRIRILRLLGRRLGMPAESVTVTRVLERLDQPDRERLSGRAASLRKALKDVDRRARRVNVMLRYAADTNHALLDALLGSPSPLRPYQPDGTRAPSAGLPRFAREL
jgi:hypothetical protein